MPQYAVPPIVFKFSGTKTKKTVYLFYMSMEDVTPTFSVTTQGIMTISTTTVDNNLSAPSEVYNFFTVVINYVMKFLLGTVIV